MQAIFAVVRRLSACAAVLALLVVAPRAAHAVESTVHLPVVMGPRIAIAFISNRPGYDRLFGMYEDGSGVIQLGDSPYPRDPDYSPDGARIAFASQGCNGCSSDIFIMNADGSGLTQVTHSEDFEESAPDWSPDGQQIAFYRVPWDSYVGDIYIVDVNGANLKQVTNTPDNQDLDPQWLPDGRIGFWRGIVGTSDLFTINADGSGESNLTNTMDVHETEAVWSPNGAKIAYVENPFDCSPCLKGIYVMNADGSNKKKLFDRSGFDLYRPAWSPGGDKIIFDANMFDPDYHSELFVMNADGSNVVQLTHSGAPVTNWAAAWRP